MIAGAIPLIDVAGHFGGDAESSRKAATQLRWAFGPRHDSLRGYRSAESAPGRGHFLRQ
jgi:hypothetical protein